MQDQPDLYSRFHAREEYVVNTIPLPHQISETQQKTLWETDTSVELLD